MMGRRISSRIHSLIASLNGKTGVEEAAIRQQLSVLSRKRQCLLKQIGPYREIRQDEASYAAISGMVDGYKEDQTS